MFNTVSPKVLLAFAVKTVNKKKKPVTCNIFHIHFRFECVRFVRAKPNNNQQVLARHNCSNGVLLAYIFYDTSDVLVLENLRGCLGAENDKIEKFQKSDEDSCPRAVNVYSIEANSMSILAPENYIYVKNTWPFMFHIAAWPVSDMEKHAKEKSIKNG